ncbi:MAG: alpha/beta hydrolase [Candidatus Hodarchaeota archaeon]
MNSKTVVYKNVEGCDIKADIYWDPDVIEEETAPVIIWIHGGALIGGKRDNISRDHLFWYLSAGYVLISIDYRLAPETKVSGIIEDLQDAFKWVSKSAKDHAPIDPTRVVVVGHSAGGYLALMSGFCVDPLPSAIVSFYGYGDFIGWYDTPDEFYLKQPIVTREQAYEAIGPGPTTGDNRVERGAFYLYCRQQGIWTQEVVGVNPVKNPSGLDPYCPLRNVTSNFPPTLLIHGVNDMDVPIKQAELMAEKLANAGVEYQFIPVQGAGHGFDGGGILNPTVSKCLSQVVEFLGKHAKSD